MDLMGAHEHELFSLLNVLQFDWSSWNIYHIGARTERPLVVHRWVNSEIELARIVVLMPLVMLHMFVCIALPHPWSMLGTSMAGHRQFKTCDNSCIALMIRKCMPSLHICMLLRFQ